MNDLPRAVVLSLARSLVGLSRNGAGPLPEPYGAIAATLEAAETPARSVLLVDELRHRGMEPAPLLAAIAAVDPSAPETGDPAVRSEVACPQLPSYVGLDPAAGRGVGRWLDRYCQHARQISPMTPALFHESAGLWLVSVAVARRLRLVMPFGTIFPNLWVLWIAPSTLYRKTTAMMVAADMARDAFAWLLTTGNVTPEALMSDLTGDAPKNLELLPSDLRDEWTKGRAFAAQRGMVMDETSGLFVTMQKDYNRGLVELYLKLYDCDRVERRSNSQGLLVARHTYLSFLGASTPRSMRPHLSDGFLWGAGVWPRFALLTPERPPEYAQSTDPGPALPIVKPLVELYQRLPDPVWPDPPESIRVDPSPEVMAAWERYSRALTCDLLVASANDGLNSAYGRMPTHLLKVAMLLAALDWPKGAESLTLEIPHLARALEIVERWRASLHRAMAACEQGDYGELSDRILRQVAAREPKGATMRDLCQHMRDRSPNDLAKTVRQLMTAGELEEVFTSPGPGGGRPTTRYRLARE